MASRSHSLPLHAVLMVLIINVGLIYAAPGKSPTAYWNSVLPNTPIPKVLLPHLLHTADMEKPFKITQDKNVHVDKGGFKIKYTTKIKYNTPSSITTLAESMELNFFMEKDFQPNKELNLNLYLNAFTKTSFLPRETADSLPFSSSKLPEIYRKFSVQPDSLEAKMMHDAINSCETKGLVGEKTHCATSLESMLDFVTSTFGTNEVKPLYLTVKNKNLSLMGLNLKQKYTISSSGATEVEGSRSVVCHSMTYPYTLFYCHMVPNTKTYVLPLVGSDGTKLEATAVCHMDTSGWNPDHVAFKVLHAKPGSVPVCHVLAPDTIVWTPKK